MDKLIGSNVGSLVAYESGELTDVEGIQMFQRLIDSGLVWNLQGNYARTAEVLIKLGYCTPKVPNP